MALFLPCSRSASQDGYGGGRDDHHRPWSNECRSLGEQGPPIEGRGGRGVDVPPKFAADALGVQGDGRGDGGRFRLNLGGAGGQERPVVQLGRTATSATDVTGAP